MKSQTLLLVMLFLQLSYSYAQKTILWKVEKEGASNSSYLFGTMHQVGNSFIDERPKIKELLLQSDIAVFESVEDKKKTIIDVMNGRPDDFSYRDKLDKKDVQFLESLSADWTVPVCKLTPAELAAKLEQLYVLNVCETTKPGDVWNHLDDYLLSLAVKNGIRNEGLETNADQFKAINANQIFDWNEAKEDIDTRIKNLQEKRNKNQSCRIARTYMGDMNFDYQFEVECAEDDPMLINRNRNWLPKIHETIKSNNAFVAVGLLHLFGDCGIISDLRRQGYKVSPVPIQKNSQ
ncbi:TraB/GumN family protein [Olivibacter ginsenosidimutans]|uniref:TraB/GumN family protein n=1 Tax=Olivibacter ginsenosidimutans TaxID=1176537 RepID=A0ABP9ACK6_9SPHI